MAKKEETMTVRVTNHTRNTTLILHHRPVHGTLHGRTLVRVDSLGMRWCGYPDGDDVECVDYMTGKAVDLINPIAWMDMTGEAK